MRQFKFAGLAAFGLVLAAAATTHVAAGAARVEENNGAISYIAPNGERLRVVEKGGSDPVLSQDGHRVALVCVDPARGGSALWLYDVRTRSLRKLLRSRPTDNNKTNLRELNHPAFSPDGRFLYIQSAAWVTEGTLFQVDLRTGAHRFVSPTNLLLIMRDGPYIGDLIVSEHTYRREGGTYEQLWLKRPDGTVVTKVPGTTGNSEDPRDWLKAHHWHAW